MIHEPRKNINLIFCFKEIISWEKSCCELHNYNKLMYIEYKMSKYVFKTEDYWKQNRVSPCLSEEWDAETLKLKNSFNHLLIGFVTVKLVIFFASFAVNQQKGLWYPLIKYFNAIYRLCRFSFCFTFSNCCYE